VLALEDLDGCATGLVALAGRPALDGRRYGVGGLLDRLVGISTRAVYVELQRHFRATKKRTTRRSWPSRPRSASPPLPPEACASRRPRSDRLFDVLTCLFTTPIWRMRDAGGAECRTVSEAARRDDGTLQATRRAGADRRAADRLQ